MRVKTEYAVANIVVVGYFDFVEKDNVLELCGISDSSAVSDDRAAADESALPYCRVLINDAGTTDIGAVKYRRAFGYPDVIAPLFKSVFGQFIAEGNDKIADVLKNFPGICFALEKLSCDGLVHVKKIADSEIFKLHTISPFCRSSSGLLPQIRMAFYRTGCPSYTSAAARRCSCCS